MSAVRISFLTVTLVLSVDAADPICFPEIGCLSMSSPWVSRHRQAEVPLSPEELPLRLDFYSRNKRNGLLDIDLTKVSINASLPMVIITHDHEDDGNALWMRSLKNAFLEHSDVNVVLMDWGSGTVGFGFQQAAANIRVIGRVMARQLRKSAERHGLSPADVHLIGEGLGAHLMGYVAKDFCGTGRITGLDPTRESFEYYDSQVRLDKTDAKFVDIVHTSSRSIVPDTGIGLTQPIGHVDFYVNIGEHQPGCKYSPTNEAGDVAWLGNLRSDECNHKKAREYFLQTVWRLNDCTFWGHKYLPGRMFERLLPKRKDAMLNLCNPRICAPLGLDTPQWPARGVFYIRTNHTSPYCIRDRIIQPPKPKDIFRVMVNSITSSVTVRHRS